MVTLLSGLVLNEKRKPFTEDEDRELHITHNFKSFTYWNLDSKPNCNDAIQTAMQWPNVAKAVSKIEYCRKKSFAAELSIMLGLACKA